MEKFLNGLNMFLLGAFIIAVKCAINAIPVYFLWNWLMPKLFHLPVITLWQSLGLAILCSLLFKSPSNSSN